MAKLREYKFEGTIHHLTTGKQLGEDTGPNVTVKVTLECSTSDVSLDKLAALSKAGALVFTVAPKQLELGDGADAGAAAEA
jgi:hypothetical protein